MTPTLVAILAVGLVLFLMLVLALARASGRPHPPIPGERCRDASEADPPEDRPGH